MSRTSVHSFDEVRRALIAINDAGWTAYTPAWAGASGNPAIGNGTMNGRYMLFGPLCFVAITIVFGSTTTPGTGNWTLSVPVAYIAGVAAAMGSLHINDDGLAQYTGTCDLLSGGNTLAMYAASRVGSASPHAWAVNDYLRLSIWYPWR